MDGMGPSCEEHRSPKKPQLHVEGDGKVSVGLSSLADVLFVKEWPHVGRDKQQKGRDYAGGFLGINMKSNLKEEYAEFVDFQI